mmetsp:Transcript_16043/g.24273  ORF Transcript_16043/g.24273 Transcript_16043/m.24273 type:complete len:103 (+) Transcript_16043:2373-2681(+)
MIGNGFSAFIKEDIHFVTKISRDDAIPRLKSSVLEVSSVLELEKIMIVFCSHEKAISYVLRRGDYLFSFCLISMVLPLMTHGRRLSESPNSFCLAFRSQKEK